MTTTVWAMDHHAGHDQADAMHHSGMESMEHMGHGQGEMLILGDEVQDGVKAMCHLMPVDAKLLPSDNKTTHHLMVMLSGAASGKAIDSATVAVKIASPDNREGAPLRLMGMGGHFGADVVLDQPGIWHFRIAAKMADGKVRHYHGHHVVK
jgi:hypothetical protein